MAVTYTLGKDATFTGLSDVRSCTATIEGTQIDVTSKSDTKRRYKAGFQEATIEAEVLSTPPAIGTTISVTHTNSGLSGTFIVTQVTENQPLDDVVSWSVTLKKEA